MTKNQFDKQLAATFNSKFNPQTKKPVQNVYYKDSFVDITAPA